MVSFSGPLFDDEGLMALIHLVWKRARRPEGGKEATRWLMVVIAILSLLVILPGLLATTNAMMQLAGLVSGVVLALSWSAGYLRKSAPWPMDLVDAVAFLTFALASPSPIAAVGLIMPAIWFRSMYGTAGRALFRVSLYAAAFGASVPLWAYIPGRTGGAMVGGLMAGAVGVVSTMFLNVLLARQLAASIRAREQAALRDAVHMSLGSQLLGVTGADEIRRIAWTSVTGICAATPALRVMMVVQFGGVLQVQGATGGFARVPATLDRAVLLVAELDSEETASATGQGIEMLHSAVGAQCVWAGVPLPTEHAQNGPAWLLLGSPRKVPPEAIASVGTLVNQVTLALRNGEVHEKLTSQAKLDSLTGLANRASFNSALSATLDDKSSQDTTVLFVDLDDFKDVNDMLGHGAGDELLREVAARLGRATRPGDLCARLGGDEFAVLLPCTSTVAGSEVARRIVMAVGAPVQIGDRVARVGASIGVATATSGIDLATLIHRADVAMYAAKAGGKAQIQVFEPGLLQVDASQTVLERQLVAAAGNALPE